MPKPGWRNSWQGKKPLFLEVMLPGDVLSSSMLITDFLFFLRNLMSRVDLVKWQGYLSIHAPKTWHAWKSPVCAMLPSGCNKTTALGAFCCANDTGTWVHDWPKNGGLDQEKYGWNMFNHEKETTSGCHQYPNIEAILNGVYGLVQKWDTCQKNWVWVETMVLSSWILGYPESYDKPISNIPARISFPNNGRGRY